MVIFRFLGQNGLKLELRTFAVHNVPNGVNFFSKAAQNCVFWLWNDFILAKPTQSCVF